MNKNMTALISCFARAYHNKNNTYRIYTDSMAERLLTDAEYNSISKSMSDGIKFFNPDFTGTDFQALRFIVNNNLAPAVLERSAFCERLIKNAVWLGCEQYLIFASGYDTTAYTICPPNVLVLEIDRQEVLDDKKSRLERIGVDAPNVCYVPCDFTEAQWISKVLETEYNPERLSFSSLLGISYYLTKEQFDSMLGAISNIISEGSEIVFDYPVAVDDMQATQNSMLASQAGEEMKAAYTYREIERLMSKHGLLIYEYMDSDEAERQFFKPYNLRHRHRIHSAKGTALCLAVKKENLKRF